MRNNSEYAMQGSVVVKAQTLKAKAKAQAKASTFKAKAKAKAWIPKAKAQGMKPKAKAKAKALIKKWRMITHARKKHKYIDFGIQSDVYSEVNLVSVSCKRGITCEYPNRVWNKSKMRRNYLPMRLIKKKNKLYTIKPEVSLTGVYWYQMYTSILSTNTDFNMHLLNLVLMLSLDMSWPCVLNSPPRKGGFVTLFQISFCLTCDISDKRWGIVMILASFKAEYYALSCL